MKEMCSKYRNSIKISIKLPMKYHTVLFDLDGTLFDYNKSERIALSAAFESFFDRELPENFFSVYHSINSDCWSDYEKGIMDNKTLRVRRFELLFKFYNMKCDSSAFSRLYLENLSKGGWIISGAKELLDSLAGRVRMAALTNGIGDVQKSRIAASGLGKYFEVVVISDLVGFAKPDKRIFEYTLGKMGLSSGEGVLMVGDSLSSDIQGGVNAGIDTCWFNPDDKSSGSIDSKFVVSSLDEIPSLL